MSGVQTCARPILTEDYEFEGSFDKNSANGDEIGSASCRERVYGLV